MTRRGPNITREEAVERNPDDWRSYVKSSANPAPRLDPFPVGSPVRILGDMTDTIYEVSALVSAREVRLVEKASRQAYNGGNPVSLRVLKAVPPAEL